MGVRIAQDGCRCAVLAEDVEDFFYIAAFLAACVEFAIRVGPCATLAEAIVALGVNGMLARDACDVAFAGMHILASFYHDRAASQLDEAKGCEESTWASSHDDDFGTLIHHGVVGLGVFVIGGEFVDIEAYGEVDEDGALACIDAALQCAHGLDGACIEPLLTSHILLYALLAGCLLGQNAELDFLNHRLVI